MKSFWVLVSGLFFAAMGVFVKLGSQYFSSAELVFYRSLIGVGITAAIMHLNETSFRTAYLKDHLTRGTLGCVGLVLYFYTMTILPLAMAVTLNHTAPIFFTLLAPVVLAERPSSQAIIAIAVGFIGVALLLRPDAGQIQIWGCSVGVLVGLLVAIGYLFIKRLGAVGEPEARTVFYYALICTVVAGFWAALAGAHPVTLENVWILGGLGATATIAQLALTRAYKTGKSMLTTSLTYSNVVFASVLGMVLWGEVLPLISWIAFGLIVSSGILASTAGFSRKQPA
jgi:drug/metabolite transporter (DMT)-like permease